MQPSAAVREVEEETGLRVRLGIPLPDQHYIVRGGIPKVVHYWSAHPPADANVAAYKPNAEIDDVRWFRLSKARKRLEYEHDVELLDTFASSNFDTSPLIIVRHSAARSRKRWSGDDAERPLTALGKNEAKRLIPLLNAYGVKRVITSDAARCVDTVLPYVDSRPVKLRLEPAISEDALRERKLRKTMRDCLESTSASGDLFAPAGPATDLQGPRPQSGPLGDIRRRRHPSPQGKNRLHRAFLNQVTVANGGQEPRMWALRVERCAGSRR